MWTWKIIYRDGDVGYVRARSVLIRGRFVKIIDKRRVVKSIPTCHIQYIGRM